MKFCCTIIFTVVVLLQSGFLFAQCWDEHVQNVLKHPGLIRYYCFGNFVTQTKSVKNLAPNKDVPDSDFSYKTNHPLESVTGPFDGCRAARLDAGYFEAAKLTLDKQFTVEMRLCKLGQGTERGNAGITNGTFWGLGNGWDSGLRLTTDYPSRQLLFSIGRPEAAKSKNLGGNAAVPDGVWQTVTATWDGEKMQLYVDGLLCANTAYGGKLTEPSWGFRLGFNDAGVGSVKMDVAELAVYQTALPPDEILQHTLLQQKLPEDDAVLYRKTVEDIFRNDYSAAEKNVTEILQHPLPASYRFAFRRFQAEIAAFSGKTVLSQRLTSQLLSDASIPKEWTAPLLRKFPVSDFSAPSAAASSAVYQRILNDDSMVLDAAQRFSVQKSLAQVLFAEGKTGEAKKILDTLKEQEKILLKETLVPQNVSVEFSQLYKNYRQTVNEPVSVKPAFPHEPASPFPPFSSLLQARDAVRKLKKENGLPQGGITVFIKGGVRPVSETFELDEQDSGTETAPIVYRAADGEPPVFTGGISVQNFKKVNDPAILKRLPVESKDSVFVAEIGANVVFPPVAPRGYGKNGLHAAPNTELFLGGKPQQIARYPNAAKPDAPDPLEASEKAFMKTGKVHRGFFDTKDSSQPGIFEYTDSRHERWTDAADAMLFGYWGHLWAVTSCKIEKTDTEKKQVILATNNPYGHRENMPYYAFNLLEEIDEPGEWYLDRQNRKLYIYPPQGTHLNQTGIRLSCFPKEFFHFKNVSHITLYGLTFEEGSGTAGTVSGGENVSIVNCNFNRFGNWGLGIDGLRHGVFSCNFNHLGGGGISLRGGSISTLSPGNCFVENCLVNDFSRIDRAYAPAVLIDGVHNRMSHNLFCDSPAQAIRAEGMEHVIEFNEIHSTVYESDDQAGIDIWGNPFLRGIVIRYNYWHHIGSGRDVAGQSGIRLDDLISSVLMYGNVFFRSSGGHFGAVQINGGKDNIIDGNVMIDCKYAVSFNPQGEKRWLGMLEGSFGKRSRESGFNPDSDIYRTKYPDYAELKQNADRNFVVRNVAVGCESFALNHRRNVLLENVMLPWMPDLFTETKGMSADGESRVPSDARKVRQKISIPQDSPLYQLTGLRPLPVDAMGLYRCKERREIPQIPVTPYFVLE